jgi:hypothetical protein
LKVNTDKLFEDFGIEEQSILAHEYAHFLQDISTTFGMIHTAYAVDYIKAIVRYISECSEERIMLPISSSKFERFLSVNDNLFGKVYFGDIKDIAMGKDLRITDIDYHQKLIENGQYNPGVVNVGIGYGGSFHKYRWRFGATAIMENMAKIMDEHLYPECPSSSLLTYHLAEMIAAATYPEFAKSKLNVLMLCDISLLSFNPGETFYSLLLLMETVKFLPTSIAQFYEYALESVKFPDVENGPADLLKLAEAQSVTAEKQVRDLFTAPELSSVGKWASDMVGKGAKKRTTNVGFIAELLTKDKLEARRYIFQDLMVELGLPVISNDVGVCWAPKSSGDDKASPLLLPAMYEVYNLLRFGKKNSACGMKKHCLTSPDQVDVDALCDTSPWKRVFNKKGLCLYAQVSKMWALENKQLILSA